MVFELKNVFKFIIIPSIVSIIFYAFWFRNEKIILPESYDLVVAVLSARQNMERRQMIRNSWAKNVSENVRLYFILGSKDCPIHPEDRKDEYGCEAMDINFKEIEKLHHYTTLSITPKEPIISQQTIYDCFTFTVHEPIRIQKLGILKDFLKFSNSITVLLLQGTSREIIVEANISNNTKNVKDRFVYVDVEEFVYPKGFEGIIQIDHFNLPKETDENMAWKDGGGVISFKAFCEACNLSTGINFYKFSNAASAISFQFIIHDLPVLKTKLREINNRKKQWDYFTRILSESVKEEQIISNDLLFTESIDIYRFLPKKLLLFYNWLMQHSQIRYQYLLKTDDDAILLLDKILLQLKLLPERNIWWGKFRKYWEVNHFGKWTELDYTSPVYPFFACGGGNVMSRDLVAWMSDNYKKLHLFQGEDVSVGIWLSALTPQLFDDERWSCDDSCDKDSFNRVQLSEKQVSKYWTTYMESGSVCDQDT